MYSFRKRKNFLLIIFIITIAFSITQSKFINNYEKNCNNNSKNEKCYQNNEGLNFLFSFSTDTCAKTSYSKSDIQKECSKGPSSYDRILKYTSFLNYINLHDYHSNGLNYVTSLFVDSDTHHFGNFMNDGAGMIILYIIDGLLLIGWIPLLYCWRKRCFLFNDCLYKDNCCILFWHIFTYFWAAAILSFLIVVLCFGK